MADYWTTPKTDWEANDGIGYEDLNRMEQNVSAQRDANFRKVQGFGYNISNSEVGQDGVITVQPGSCYSDNGVPIRMNAAHTKNLKTWAAGNGASIGGMAAGATPLAFTWFYIFVIMDPETGDTEIMIDDNLAGSNISSGIYTEKRYIHAFKTDAAGTESSFDIVEMFAVGDNVFINPISMYLNEKGDFNIGTSNVYASYTIKSGTRGPALPAKAVKAKLVIQTERANFGVISKYGGHFTVPTNLINGSSVKVGEYVAEFPEPSGGYDAGSHQSNGFDIMVDSDNLISIALEWSTGSGQFYLACRGYHDDRTI